MFKQLALSIPMSERHEPSSAGTVPAVSVVLPVYNGEPFLVEALDSILGQTFGDFELIAVCDPSSSDNSRSLLDDAARRDSRVHVLQGPIRNLAAALNLGLSRARGEFIARMDADDVSLSNRFARQVEYLREHPDIAVVGATITMIDAGGSVIREIDYPLTPVEVDRFLIEIGCALAHPATMGRRAALLSVGGYRELFQHAEDYDLWLRMAECYSLANLPDRLLRYRHHDDKVSLRYASAQWLATHLARLCAKARRSGQSDPLEGRSSLSLDDLDRFDLGVDEREAIVRIVMGAAAINPSVPMGDMSLQARMRLAVVAGLRRVLPAAWFERLRNFARAQG
jgi:glycosyltransferase involved in cell wall biosynthesis